MPILLIHRKRSRCPKATVNLIHYCLDQRPNGIVLLGQWSSYEHVHDLLTNVSLFHLPQSPHLSRIKVYPRAVDSREIYDSFSRS